MYGRTRIMQERAFCWIQAARVLVFWVPDASDGVLPADGRLGTALRVDICVI